MLLKKIPERFLWAVEMMNLKPSQRILEIGCGTGQMAALIASKLKSGKIIAIDRSAAMIKKAEKNNELVIKNGKAEFRNIAFPEFVFKNENFDIVTAFNVNFFQKENAEEFKTLRNVMKKNSLLYVFYQAPYEINLKASAPFCRVLERNGFEIEALEIKKMEPTSAICVVGKLYTLSNN